MIVGIALCATGVILGIIAGYLLWTDKLWGGDK